jgi:hypothetical protein
MIGYDQELGMLATLIEDYDYYIFIAKLVVEQQRRWTTPTEFKMAYFAISFW